jgi:regulator of protease activity HflC (stomatin/prohibitin superfamily)
MAEVTRLLFVRHLRSESSRHVVLHRGGNKVRSARGASFWFLPMAASVAEVPVDDRELPILFHGMTKDFQPVVVQGGVTWRVADPERLADRVDFTIDLGHGRWVGKPLEQVGGVVTELAQQVANAYLGEVSLAEALADGVDALRTRIAAALAADPGLDGLGVDVTSVRIAAVRADADVERALQTPVREQIQREADKATFDRRAHAVENERAIAENELRNKIELAKREEALIAQRGVNEQRRLKEEALALRIQAEAAHERTRMQSAAEAGAIREVEAAKADGERGRVAIYRDLPSDVLLGLAVRELAGKLPDIENLTITPDLLGPALARLARGGA